MHQLLIKKDVFYPLEGLDHILLMLIE